MRKFDIKTRLAVTVRLFEALDLFDMNGHVSVRVEDGFLTHGRQAARGTVTLRDLILVDWDGKLKQGEQEPPNEVYLHSEIYRLRPDVHAIAHFHGHWSNIISVAGIAPRPVSSVTCVLGRDIPVYQDPDSISDAERGREVAHCLGTNKVLLLRGHGVVTAGNSLEEVLVLAKYLEINSQRQVFARLLNRNAQLEDDEIDSIGAALWTPKNIEKSWTYYYEKTSREGTFIGIL
ncbi:MAG: class II aldolase/adducin family protein [Alicyclobacillus herbarius]|uniref:class II aldolase/adducin family protein n=1 Tax=Alicyclobacillus herbarius TaxID=122960 RepID=UPI0023575546|nr:class II aldolase/adducin family protein [Alicyclobacillus herbarius]MCL6633395.1 class II aldolase/adducin family protein [Alicyclobacillus herbarius]